MAVIQTFAKRKRAAENADKQATYYYDDLPDAFRVQVFRILLDAIGNPDDSIVATVQQSRYNCWMVAHHVLTKEMGVFKLTRSEDTKRFGYMAPCLEFIQSDSQVDEVLSLIELLFRAVEMQREGTSFWFDAPQQPHDAINELNHRFREHSVGYQFAGGQIVQVDSEYLHSEVVKPAIFLLHSAQFEGALDEFMTAHSHYREGRYKEAIAAAGNAFESTMKTICDRRNWDYKRETSSALMEVLFSNGLVPSELNSHFTSLRATLESGLPTVRNQAGHGAHGQGSDTTEVPDYLAAYCLHLAAANIVFLIEAHNAKG